MKKKVLYVFGGEKASGAEIVIERLMLYNVENAEPHLFISPGSFAENLIASKKPYAITVIPQLRKLNRSNTGKITFYLKALSNYFSISRKVLQYCRKKSINIIHANTVVPASYLIPAILYSKVVGNKKLWIWSDHDIKHFAKLDHYFSGLCSKLYDKTLVVSNAVKKKYGQRKSVEVLYNGLDTEIYKPDEALRTMFRRTFNIDSAHYVFGIAGTITPRKGQVELIEVFKELLPSCHNIQLIIAGGYGPDDTKYNDQFAEAIKNTERITYLGHHTDMLSFYNCCDIIINNSSVEGSEPLGTTIYEAMACEKLVIASDTGGTAEIIDNGDDGILFEAGSSADLKRAIETVIKIDKDLATRIEKEARQKVIQKFAISKMKESYNKMLDEI